VFDNNNKHTVPIIPIIMDKELDRAYILPAKLGFMFLYCAIYFVAVYPIPIPVATANIFKVDLIIPNSPYDSWVITLARIINDNKLIALDIILPNIDQNAPCNNRCLTELLCWLITDKKFENLNILPLLIHLLVVLLVVAAGDVVHPLLVFKIPLYGLFDSLLELERRFPAEFTLQLC